MTALTRSAPSSQGTDARGIVAFLDAIDGVAGIETHGVMLLRHGHVIAEGWWDPYRAEGLHQLYSLSKSFTSTAAGFAWAEKLLDLDAPVVSYFPELDAEVTDPRSRSILVRHVASMSAGHTTEQWNRAVDLDHDEPVRGFLLDPPDGTPGVTFAYSQSTTYVLGATIQRITGSTLLEYLRPRLFEPLGIGGDAFWLQHPPGRDIGFAGLHATTEAAARLGQLYLQGGMWEGRQLLAPEWVAEATRKQVENGDGGDPASDWTQGYGFQFWMSRHGYRGDGAYGQLCVVLPEQDAVLAVTGETEDMQAVLDAAWRYLLPAFGGEGSGSAEADAALRKRLTGLRLPFPDGEEVPDGEFSAASSALRKLERISVTAHELTLHEQEGSTTLPLIPGAWPPPVGHLSARAALTDAHTVTVHVQFTQTPHKLLISCDRRTGTFTAQWRTIPLMARSISSLAAFADPARRQTEWPPRRK